MALTLVGLVPIVGDIAKFLGKTVVRGGNLEDVIKLIRSINPGFIDDIAQLKDLLKQNWGKGVQAAKDRWNTALGQLLNWVNGIPDLLFSQQKRQLIEVIQEVKSQSDKMLSRAFDEIRRKIDEALDEIGRLLDPNRNLATANGAPIPGRADNLQSPRNEPMRIEGGNPGGRVPRYIRLDELIQRRNAVIAECGEGLVIRAEGNLRALLRNADIFIRIREPGLEGMLRDGRYKTIFETGAEEAIQDPTSYAAQAITRRRNGEERLFGYPQDLPPQNRPVYGYVARQADSPEAGIVGLGYGENIVIKVKPETRTRATFTADDS